MSSPIALKAKNSLRKLLISFHQKASHDNRVETLSDILAEMINGLQTDRDQIRCLDIGCGDMSLAEKISAKTDKELTWSCIDIRELPEDLKSVPKWSKYQMFDGQNIPFADEEFDVAIIVDVLHHDLKNAQHLVQEAARVSNRILIKDHYEYGFYSRTMLKLMDFVGNWAYGVEIPKKYFSIAQFKKLVGTSKLKICKEIRNIKLYNRIPLLQKFLSDKWQFIALIEK